MLFSRRLRIIRRVEPDPSDDARLLQEAAEHTRRLAGALAEDQRDLAQPHLAPAQRAKGTEALARLLASVSCLADSLQRTTPS